MSRNKYNDKIMEYFREISEGRSVREMFEKAKEDGVEEKYGIELTREKLRDICFKHNMGVKRKNRYSDEAIKEITEIIKEKGSRKGALQEIKNRKIEEKYGIKMNLDSVGYLAKKHRISTKRKYEVGEETGKGRLVRVKVKKQGEERWEVKSRYIWKQYNGDIKEGNVIIHLDGDEENNDIENLQEVDRSVLPVMAKCGLYFDDPEKTKAAIKIAELKIARKGAEKRLKKRKKEKEVRKSWKK